MKSRVTGCPLEAIVVCLVLLSGPAAEVRAALTYDVTLGAGVQTNDNLHLDPPAAEAEGLRAPVEETIFTARPGVVASWRAERDRLDFRYAGEYATYQGDEERDPRWVHTLAADLNWRRWDPFFLEAREERSQVPRTQEREGEAEVDLVDRNRMSVRTGLSSELGARSTVELSGRWSQDSYSGIDGYDSGAGETTAVGDEFDRVRRLYGEATVRRRWSPLWGSELRVRYGKVDRELTADYTELNVFAAVDQRWSERLSLRYRVEWIREEDEETAGEEPASAGEEPSTEADTKRSNLLLGVDIRGALERDGSWNLAYQDRVEDQPDGDTLETGRASAALVLRARLGSTLDAGGWHETREFRESGREEVAWGPTLGVRWLIRPWAAFDLVGSWTHTTIREEDQPEVEDETLRVAAGVVLLMFNRLQLDVGYGYRENDSADSLRRYTNNLFFALLTFHFKPVEPGELPVSFASGLAAGGTPSGGSVREP